jgi:hypothetical protein
MSQALCAKISNHMGWIKEEFFFCIRELQSETMLQSTN